MEVCVGCEIVGEYDIIRKSPEIHVDYGTYISSLCIPALEMATLTELCAGLPLDPLPPYRAPDPGLPHAPVRTPSLSPEDKKVRK